MAIIEVVSDSSSGEQTPPLDDIEVEELEPSPSPPREPTPPPVTAQPTPPVSPTDPTPVVNKLRELATNPTSSDITTLLSTPEYASLPLEEQANLLFPFLLHPSPPSVPDATSLAQHILQTNIRTLFLSNPNISTSGRAQKPSIALLDDASHDQAWKIDGIDLALRWCISQLAPLSSKLNLILPPTLTMMDDWAPAWRVKGVNVLASWVFQVPPEDLKSRGLDALLLASLEHTLSLHEDTPGVLDIAVRLVEGLHGEDRAKHYTALVEKALVAGWKYANREQQPQIAKDTEVLCAAMGEGIARWTEAIIPSLLSPLQHPPTPATLQLVLANLSALQTFIQTVDEIHTQRWRGQILTILARCWVMVRERWPEVEAKPAPADFDIEMDASADPQHSQPTTEEQVATVLAAIKRIYALLADLPGVREDFNTLLKTNESIFSPLVSPLAA